MGRNKRVFTLFWTNGTDVDHESFADLESVRAAMKKLKPDIAAGAAIGTSKPLAFRIDNEPRIVIESPATAPRKRTPRKAKPANGDNGTRVPEDFLERNAREAANPLDQKV